MTDKEKLRNLFTEFGIGFEEWEGNIACCQGQKKIVGYSGFETIFEFDSDESFLKMGAWE